MEVFFVVVFKEVLLILKVSEHFALPSTEARWLIREEGWGWGERGERVKAGSHTVTWKTEKAVDCCQNDQNVMAVSLRHCTATSVLCNCCLNCCAGQSHKDNVHSTAVE